MPNTVHTVRPALLIDIGGVLAADHLRGAATDWANRLGIAPQAFVSALYAGNDDQILIGRTSEDAWWSIVADRLGVGPAMAAEIRRDLARRQGWNAELLTGLRRLRHRASSAVVSNAWPSMRTAVTDAGLEDFLDAVVLSCEVGCAKPDPRIYLIALDRLGADPARTLFVDDTPGHVEAARSLGVAGHVHVDAGGTLSRIEQFISDPQSG